MEARELRRHRQQQQRRASRPGGSSAAAVGAVPRPPARAPAANSSAALPTAASAPRLRYYGLCLSVNEGAGHVGAARVAQSEPMCAVRAVGVHAPCARALAGARARCEPQPASRGGRRARLAREGAAARWPEGRRGRAPAARRSPRRAASVARSRLRVAGAVPRPPAAQQLPAAALLRPQPQGTHGGTRADLLPCEPPL